MKITIDKALIEQAISALLREALGVDNSALRQKLREALAEPAVEPVTTWLGTDWDAHKQLFAQLAHLEPGTDLYTSPPPPAEHSCKWPTCQTEKYQQDLADQLARELIGTPPDEVATLPIKNSPTRTGVFAYIDAEIHKK